MSDQRGATLTSAQEAAVAATVGPVLIIAGPGSGKTHTLVARIVHLVTQCGVAPEQILVSTFTDKAAAELVSRVSTALAAAGVAVNLNEMLIGTLHSLCLRLVDEHREFTRLKRSYTVLDQFEQQYLLFRRMREFRAVEGIEAVIGAGLQSGWDIAEKLARRFNQCSEELLDAGTLSQSDHADVAALGRLYERYLALLVEENSLDFSTIQVEAWRLLDSRPEVLAALQERVRYLMVDEYQDTNTVQEAILALLAGKHCNLCVVGDDDQGLYRFRGATIRNILEFPSLLPDRTCRRVVLRDNFRSHPDIVEFFQQWMARTDWHKGGRSFRFDKDIDASSGQTWAGPGVVRVGVPETEAWHAEVVALLHHLQASGRLADWNQVAFLFRSVKHDKAIGLARALEAAGIPVYAPRSGLYFERTEVRRMVGALISVFPQWQPTLQEGWPVGAPPPPVWSWYDACVGEFADALGDPANADLLRWCRQKVRAHAAGEETPYAFSGLFYQLLQFPMFARYLGEPALGGVLDSRPARNLAILSGLLTRFEYLHHVDVLKPDRLPKILSWLGNTYLRFLFDGGIEEFEDPSDYAPAGCVGFLTVHQSKGLEFPVVVVDSLYAVPKKSHDDLDVRLHAEYLRKPAFEPWADIKVFDFFRLYYTAFSRAQNLLVLTCPVRDTGHRVPSSWFRAVWDEVPDWRAHTASLGDIELALLKPVDLKQSYSFTGDITVFENCARQYKFLKALAFSPVRSQSILFGTLVHQTIEDVHKTALGGDAATITAAQIDAWFEDNYRQLTTKERRYLAPNTKASALGQVQRYAAQQSRAGWAHVLAAEVDVSLVKPGYILQGSIDLLAGDADSVEVVDFKSERKPDLFREPERVERYRRQLEVYGHLVQQRLGKSVSKLHLHYTAEPEGSNPRISFDMSAGRVGQTLAAFDATVARIEAKDFHIDRRPPQKVCDGCDMRHHCDAC